MTSFTILHWFAICTGIFLFLFISYFIKKFSEDLSSAFKLILILFFTMLIVTFASLYVLDSFTKKVKLVEIKHKRVLRNETIVFKGRVKNIGKFKVSAVILKIKILNGENKKLAGDTSFFSEKDQGFFSVFRNKDLKIKKKELTKVEKKVVIIKNLAPKETKSFSVSIDYPPYFKKPRFINKLSAR